MEQEQNEEGEFEGLESEEEPEIKVEEDTEEEMQGDASPEEAPEIRKIPMGKSHMQSRKRFRKNLQEPFLLRIMQTVFLEIHRKMNS